MATLSTSLLHNISYIINAVYILSNLIASLNNAHLLQIDHYSYSSLLSFLRKYDITVSAKLAQGR
jgi:hypothetical protein